MTAMTISDTERREVARRLRELPTDMYEVEELWEMKGLDTCCKDQTDYYLIHFALFECFPVDHMHPCDYEELHTRLADLIEPSCDALQETADENAAAYADAETMQDERGYRYQKRIGSVTLKSNNGYDLLDAMLELGA